MSQGPLEVSGWWNRYLTVTFLTLMAVGHFIALVPETWLHSEKVKKALRLSAQSGRVIR